MNQNELIALWQTQLTGLPLVVAQKCIGTNPETQDASCPVTWSMVGSLYQSAFPYMGGMAYMTYDANGIIQTSDRPYAEAMLPAVEIAAIEELCPTWTPSTTSSVIWSSPISNIRQVANTHGGSWANWTNPCDDVQYLITFNDPQYTADALKNTNAYKTAFPTVIVKKNGFIE